MRRLFVTLLVCGLVAAPAALAFPTAAGDGILELRAVDAAVTINGKGALWGQMDSGRLIVTDPVDGDGNIYVSGAEHSYNKSDSTTIYWGKDIHFRITGGTYQLRFKALNGDAALDPSAHGIDLTAVGIGKMTIPAITRSTAGNGSPCRCCRRRTPSATSRSSVSAQAPNILVVEDESSIASFVSLYLKNAGYTVRTASTGADALAQVGVQMPGLIVLDLMLPDMDGIEVCKRIRQTSDVPILMLTARDEDVDKIIGLEVGADDYLTKPFNPRELVARVKSILRRATPERRERETEVITHGDLRVDAGRREVTVAGEEVQLAPKEFDLLWELLDHRGLVLTRDQLLERVWGYTFAGDTRTVDVHVRQLRRKLGEASPIVTVWGVGYKVSPAKDARKETTKT
jgi:DNA-binding response OmpR family regulator